MIKSQNTLLSLIFMILLSLILYISEIFSNVVYDFSNQKIILSETHSIQKDSGLQAEKKARIKAIQSLKNHIESQKCLNTFPFIEWSSHVVSLGSSIYKNMKLQIKISLPFDKVFNFENQNNIKITENSFSITSDQKLSEDFISCGYIKIKTKNNKKLYFLAKKKNKKFQKVIKMKKEQNYIAFSNPDDENILDLNQKKFTIYLD